MLPQLGVHCCDLDSEVMIVHLWDMDVEIIIKTVNRMIKKQGVKCVKWGHGRQDPDSD